MKTTQLTSIAITAILSIGVAACSASKKSSASTVSSAPASTTSSTTPSSSLLLVNPSYGTQAPGDAELTAIQAKYNDVTLDKLKQGHEIYTNGACIHCHEAGSIYRHDEAQWKDIIDDMALKANITDAEKDAVYKYVLAIKATQPK